MTTYGRSYTATEDETETQVADNTAAIDALMDNARWTRRRLAHLDDLAVEPDDINRDDEIKNWERDAE